jgi:hypothetical protein
MQLELGLGEKTWVRRNWVMGMQLGTVGNKEAHQRIE